MILGIGVGYSETMLSRLVLALLLAAAGERAQEPSGTIVGTVTDVTGAAIAHTAVTIEGAMPVAGVNTDPSGEFVIDHVPRGTYTLRFESPGFIPKEVKVAVKDTGVKSVGLVTLEVDLILFCHGKMKPPVIYERKQESPGKSQVSGVALEGGAAVAKLKITLRTADTRELIGTMRTDERGRFQFLNIAPGNYELWVLSDPTLRLRVRKDRDLEVRLSWAALPADYICL